MNTIANQARTGLVEGKSQAVPAHRTGQYTLWQILGIWALAAHRFGFSAGWSTRL